MMDTVETLAVRVKELELSKERNNEEHGRMFSRIESVEKEHSALQSDVEHIRELCDEIKTDVKDIKDRPAKRYEGLVNAVTQWLVLAMLAAVIVFE